MILIKPVSLEDKNDIFEMSSSLAMTFDVSSNHKISDFVRVLKDKSTIFLLSKYEGKTVGYFYGNIHYAFYAAKNIAWIKEIFVKKGYRNIGIATALINRAEAIGKQQECALISVATRRAEGLYVANGFENSASYFSEIALGNVSNGIR